VLRLALGQTATVSLDAVPGKPFSGVVTEIGASALPLAGPATAAREFRVVVRLERPDPSLRPGLTCDAEIVTSDRRDVTTVPLQSVVLRASGPQSPDRSGVFVVSEGRARFSPVEPGIIGGLSIEVGGVAPGTPIVVGPYQTLRELQEGAVVRVNQEPATK
jgi:HlyD family secretion protein